MNSVRVINNEFKSFKDDENQPAQKISFNNNVRLKNISYRYYDNKEYILKDLNLEIKKKSVIGVVGPSGSGKTTLLGICAGLDSPSSGDVLIEGESLSEMSEDDRADVRNRLVGFVFQNFQLLPTLTALENVQVPLELRGEKSSESIAKDLLKKVGLEERIDHYPVQLSGGEQQRVAIARAFINRPKILFADEPTGNLHDSLSRQVMALMTRLVAESGCSLLLVTHNREMASFTDRRLLLEEGHLQELTW